MISPPLSQLGNDLRQAVGRRDYAAVQSLLPAVCASAAGEARSLPAGDPRGREIAAWVNELLGWTGVMLRVARSAHADQLRNIPFLKGYLHHQARPESHLRVDL